MSFDRVPGWKLPEVPTRIKVSAPDLKSSSIAIALEGQPIPVEVTETATPLKEPVYVTYSRFVAMWTALSKREAMIGTRPGSPGIKTYLPTSPFSVRV